MVDGCCARLCRALGVGFQLGVPVQVQVLYLYRSTASYSLKLTQKHWGWRFERSETLSFAKIFIKGSAYLSQR